MKSGFVEGETYYVKMKKGIIVGDLIFTNYASNTGLWNTSLWFDDISGRRCYLFELNEINIYRYVSEEYAKDQTSLISVLKRLMKYLNGKVPWF